MAEAAPKAQSSWNDDVQTGRNQVEMQSACVHVGVEEHAEEESLIPFGNAWLLVPYVIDP